MNNYLLNYIDLSHFSFDENAQNKLNKITDNINCLEQNIERTKQELLNEKHKKAEIIIEQLNKRKNSISGEILYCDNMLFIYAENKWRYYEEVL